MNTNGELVTIFINSGDEVELFSVGVPSDYKYYETSSTFVTAMGEQLSTDGEIGRVIKIPGQSITTIVYKK